MQKWSSVTLFVVIEFYSVLAIKGEQRRNCFQLQIQEMTGIARVRNTRSLVTSGDQQRHCFYSHDLTTLTPSVWEVPL